MQHNHEPDPHQSPQSARWRRALPWVAGIVLGIVVAGVGMRMRVPADSQATIRLTAVHPGGEVVGSPIDADVVLSSNGTHIVYVAALVVRRSGGCTGAPWMSWSQRCWLSRRAHLFCRPMTNGWGSCPATRVPG